MNKQHKPCLILNQNYTPLTIISWKRALCLEIIGNEIPGEGVVVLDHYEDDYVMSSGGDQFFIPSVAVTPRFIKKRNSIPVKRYNVAVRDDSTCQYCNTKLPLKKTTIDHVIPKSSFDKKENAHTWNNVVIACSKCNTKKGSKTLEQAGMKLLKEPLEPSPHNFISFMPFEIPEEWRIYVRS